MSDKRTPGRSLDEWMELVAACRQSGLTDAAWCHEHGISPSCFYNAVSRLRKRACQIPDPSRKASILDLTSHKQDVVQIAIEPDKSPAELISMERNNSLYLENSHTIEIEADGLRIRMSNDVQPVLLRTLMDVADYIVFDDSERFQKLVGILQKEIRERKKKLADAVVQNFEVYNQVSAEKMKAIVLVIDNFDVVKELGYEAEEFFQKISRDGYGLGIFVIATATRSNSMKYSTYNNFKNKVAGYLFDESDVNLIVGRSTYKQSETKGRALLKYDNMISVMQLYSMVGFETELEYKDKIEALIQNIDALYPGEQAPRIPVLPENLFFADMKEYPHTEQDIYVGLEKEAVCACGFQLGNTPFTILGEAARGKTNVLKVILDQMLGKGKIYLVDSKAMELYSYKTSEEVVYIENQTMVPLLIDALKTEIAERNQKVKEQLLAGIVSVTVGTALIFATAGAAAPIVFSAAVVGGTSTLYGLSNATEGMNNISLGFSGDGFTMAENPIRDTLFAGNPDLYYTIGNASTMISAMALPMSGILKGATGAAKFKTIAVDGGRILIGNVAEDKVYDAIYQSTDSRILAMLGSNVVEGVLSGNPANSSVSEIGDVARKTDIKELGYRAEKRGNYKTYLFSSGKYSAFGDMTIEDGKRYFAWNKLREEGLSYEQAENIRYIEKGKKPVPEAYLSTSYIEQHLKSFKDNGAVKIMPYEPNGTIGGKGGTFVLSKDELEEIIQFSKGDVSKIETILGLDQNYLGENPIIVTMNDVSSIRIPSGNELGAWPEYWKPGGYTSGGIKEAIIDPVPEGKYTYKHLFE